MTDYTHCACCGELLSAFDQEMLNKTRRYYTCENKTCPAFGFTYSEQQHRKFCEDQKKAKVQS